jgi:hypothetical protein
MTKIVEPPESTKSIEDCEFLSSNGICYNPRNYLRQHRCKSYCVEKVDKWLRKTHPELDNEAIKQQVIKITQHQYK